ncbi:hypothetical protein ACH3XW_41805 [Acanthocheilonema viteae]
MLMCYVLESIFNIYDVRGEFCCPLTGGKMFRFPVKRMLAVWIWPLLAATLIITDWRTMKRLRATGHTTILDAMRDENTTHEII